MIYLKAFPASFVLVQFNIISVTINVIFSIIIIIISRLLVDNDPLVM